MASTKEIEEYTNYLRERELTEGTIEIYGRRAKVLEAYLDGRPVTKEKMIIFKQQLSEAGFAVTTQNLYIAAANSYLLYLGKEDCTVRMLRIQRRRSLENVLDINEYRLLLDYARESRREKYYCILKTLAMTGIRVGELKYFSAESLNGGTIIVNNKGKIREIYLADSLRALLCGYCDSQGIKSGYIFRGDGRGPISRAGVNKMLAYMADQLGIPRVKVHPHSLRHLFALTYMEHYKNLPELADILGHSCLETTRIYTTSSPLDKQKKLEKLGL